MNVRVLDEPTIRDLIDVEEAHVQVRRAFEALAMGKVILPDVMFLPLEASGGEVHVKGGYVDDAPVYCIKVASGFAANRTKGLPTNFGVVWAFDAQTGFLDTILFDNGFLTELRTGAAGGVAADLLAKDEIVQLAVIGCGVQARYQLDAFLHVRRPRSIKAYCRTRDALEAYVSEMRERHDVEIVGASSVKEAVIGSDAIITTTPSTSPVIDAGWVAPGCHITAMGADTVAKRELDPALFSKARLVADSRAQCLTQGELHHGVAAGTVAPDDVIELGDVALGRGGRADNDEVTICDLTGVGVLDAAVATAVVTRARVDGLGRTLDV
jgi:ornithine cyclodeaminase/alanine dehydrogenase-like protein (mu-crystallin family)